MTKYYHVTHTKNVPSILKYGLNLPKTLTSGSRSIPGIYLYKNKEDANFHLPSLSASGSLPIDVPYSILQINLPKSLKIFGDPEYDESVVIHQSIPSKNIKLLSNHSADYSEFENIDWDKR